jgi:Tol biopolymer transport system component
MKRPAQRICLVAVIAGSALVAALPAWSAGTPRTQLTSVGSDGSAAHGNSSTYGVALSGDGRRALFTVDDDALPGADGTMDVYVRDRQTGKTRLVSKSSGGEPANAGCGDGPAISADGRFVAFRCDADNLAGGTGGLFVRDLKRGKTRLASRTSDGAPATGGGERPGLSADGRFVVFESNSDNLPGRAGIVDAYVRDMKRGNTRLVSKATDGTPVDDNSARYPSISGNGRFAVFQSSSDLLPGNPGTADVYVRDRREGTTRLVSRASNGTPANGGSSPSPGAISGDGRLVVFESNAANLGATLSDSAVIRDLQARTTRIVSRTANGGVADGEEPSISANGRYVAYGSNDDDLPGVLGVLDVYRFDREAKKTILVSRATGGKPANDDSFYASPSAAGRVIAFTSRADNLSGADDNLYSNTFVRIP